MASQEPQQYSWAIWLMRSRRNKFMGVVQAPDRQAAEATAMERFNLTAEQRKLLVITQVR